MFEYKTERVSFVCHESNDVTRQLLLDGKKLDFVNSDYFTIKENSDPFDPNRGEIDFSPDITNICHEIFNTIKKMHTEKIDRRYYSLLASSLFESLASYWKWKLLARNLDRIGIRFWRKILHITKEWQKENQSIFIHTGTPYYFLAENYFMVGDLDSAFTYLHNALKIDEQTWQWNYEGHIGAYSLAKLIDDGRTQMNYLSIDRRNELNKYILQFSKQYKPFTIEEFDRKFLKNERDYHFLGYFFTYTFHVIVHNQRNAVLETSENYFSKLRTLDILFNLCLIIDKILENIFLKNESDPNKRTISFGIAELCKNRQWVNSYKFMKFLEETEILDKNYTEKNIPILLSKNEQYEGRSVEKEVFTMLLVYYLRNYGAHNLNEMSIFVEKYDEIVNELMMALFLSVDAISN